MGYQTLEPNIPVRLTFLYGDCKLCENERGPSFNFKCDIEVMDVDSGEYFKSPESYVYLYESTFEKLNEGCGRDGVAVVKTVFNGKLPETY